MVIYKHTSTDRTPYTYLIGWSSENKWYYGVRYAKGCHPNDLWITYFTSSKIVKKYTEKHGSPNIIQIRKIFKDCNSAFIWEQTVLKKINAENNKKYLNGRNTTGKIVKSEDINSGRFKPGQTPHNKGISIKDIVSVEERKKRYGRHITEQEKNNLRIINKKRMVDGSNREHIRNKTKEQFNDPIKKQKHKDACLEINVAKETVWMNFNNKNFRIKQKNVDQHLNLGYKTGRVNFYRSVNKT